MRSTGKHALHYELLCTKLEVSMFVQPPMMLGLPRGFTKSLVSLYAQIPHIARIRLLLERLRGTCC
jgi:hypothetical protein